MERSDKATARTRGATRVTAAGPPAAALDRPEALAVTPHGTLILRNQGTSQILDGAPDGPRTVLAGTGAPATPGTAGRPSGVAVGGNETCLCQGVDFGRVERRPGVGRRMVVVGPGVTDPKSR